VTRKPIVAIDGPAGAGKSTVARLVAERLGLIYLDTGAMYRAITLAILRAEIALEPQAIAQILDQTAIALFPAPANQPVQVSINGTDVTKEIRQAEVTSQVSKIAALPQVREVLSNQQQAYGVVGGVVMEGRDIGTQIFPDAELKIFLTASVEERAKRRQKEMLAASNASNQNVPEGTVNFENAAIETIIESISARDYQDSHRAIAPLCQAKDAIEVDTDGRSIEEIVESIIDLFHSRLTESDSPH
jgi:pantoate ligase / CMP/dCMP kinase